MAGMREVCQGSSPSLSSRSGPAAAPAHPNIYITPGLAWPGRGSTQSRTGTTGPWDRADSISIGCLNDSVL